MGDVVLARGHAGFDGILKTPLRVRIFFFGLLWAIWEIVAQSEILTPQVFVPTSRILGGFVEVASTPLLYTSLSYTLLTCLSGFLIAVVAGSLIGMGLGASRLLGDALMPYVLAISSGPKIIFLPVVMAFTGFGPDLNVWMAFIGAMFPLAISTYAGMLAISPVHVKVARSFNISAPMMVWKVYLPSLRGPLLVGARIGLGGALVTTVLSESKFGQNGMGYLTLQYYSAFNIPRMFAVLMVLFVVAIGLNFVMGRFTSRIDR
jgi:NitT/TauT family transport system permease protein